MKEEYKVSNIGDIVYAYEKLVFVYKQPSVNTRLENLYYAGDDPSWTSGGVIGEFEGTRQKVGSELWLKVRWNHKRRRVGAFNIRGAYMTEVRDGWVLDKEVSKVHPSQINQAILDEKTQSDAEKAAREAEELRRLLEGIGNDNKAPKATLGSTLGITKTNTDGTSTVNYVNITIYVSVLVAGIVVFLKFFKPKK